MSVKKQLIYTQEQADIFDYVKSGRGNLVVRARAGSGKTTTMLECLNYLPKPLNTLKPGITICCYNVHIQKEIKSKVPSDVFVNTTHSLGYGAICRKYGEVKVDDYKVHKIIRGLQKKWGYEYRDETYTEKLVELVKLAKLTVSLKPNQIKYIASKYLIQLDPDGEDIKRVLKILELSTLDTKTIDFADQVYMPATDKKIWMYPQDFVFVDECFPANSRVVTDKGNIKIGDLAKLSITELPMAQSFNETYKKFEYRPIRKVWCNGEKDVYQIKLHGKTKIRSTANHKFLTVNGWKRLDELKIGDGIISNSLKQPAHEIPNKVQEDIFLGSILGDGSVQRISKNISRIKIIHGLKEKDYIRWKFSFFNSDKLEFIEKNGYSKKPAYRFSSKGLYIKDDLIKEESIIQNINERILSIMWMDDGSLNYENGCGSSLYSTASSKILSELLSVKLFEKFNIFSTVKELKSTTTARSYYLLKFDTVNTKKISSLLKSYIIPEMSYKLLDNDKGCFDPKHWINHEQTVGCMVVSSTLEFYKREKVYDIEVDVNHNFILGNSNKNKDRKEDRGIVAHNCQDLNRAQHYMINKMLKRTKLGLIGKFYAFGDDFQSIMSFSGSDSDSFEWFVQQEKTAVLPLTQTFRCGKAIVKEANVIVSDVKATTKSHEGLVREGDVLEDSRAGDFVLCRVNKPLVRLFFELFLRKKKAIIKGSDFGRRIVELVNKYDKREDMVDELNYQLNKYRLELIDHGITDYEKHQGYSSQKDFVDCVLLINKTITNISQFKIRVKEIFCEDEKVAEYSSNSIILSTIHKAKGLEAERVFIIKPQMLMQKQPLEWMDKQESNLKYVAITRAKNELIYDYKWTDEKK